MHVIFPVPGPVPAEAKEPDSPGSLQSGPLTEPSHTYPYAYIKDEDKTECPILSRPEPLVTASRPYYMSGKCTQQSSVTHLSSCVI